jgi:hypothetical protein
MSTHKTKNNFLNSTAVAALLVTLSAPIGFAQQANVQATLGALETISTAADYTAGVTQELTASPSATTVNSNVNITLNINDSNYDTVTLAAPATNNLISASATGNISSASAILAVSPATAGDTAAVGTLQSVEAGVTASSISGTHSIVIENEGSGVRTLTGAALQDNNDITASATGNSGTSSMTMAMGVDVIEDASAAFASVSLDNGIALSSADLVVSSSQEIYGGGLSVNSEVVNAATNTSVEDVRVATVTITNSDQASSTTGNTATNSIQSIDTSALITASTAVSNQQSINSGGGVSTVSAKTMSSEISIDTGIDVNISALGDVNDSTISLTNNSQTSAATGSASAQTLTLDASSITGQGTYASIFDSNGFGSGSGIAFLATGDAVIGNDQKIDSGVTVHAMTISNRIALDITSDDDTENSKLEIDGNTQSASATGVSTTNALSLTSGAVMSAAGAVGSVQSVDGAVWVETIANNIHLYNESDEDVNDSTMLTTNNTVSASATGASASNTLSTTADTNNLSLSLSLAGSGSGIGSVVANGIISGTDQPYVIAGMVLTNDQAQSGSVTATAIQNQIFSEVSEDDIRASRLTSDGNTLSASALANLADNAINLSFNALTGTISGSGLGVVAGVANEQTLSNGMTVTARNVGTNGLPVLVYIEDDVFDTTISNSSNEVVATARGNVTTGNTVIVDATNITSGSQAEPEIDITSGAWEARGSFVAGSTQVSGADILASQLDVGGDISNTIFTELGYDVDSSSTVVSDANLLSAAATANSASNAVQLGDAETALIKASGVVANYQSTTSAGSVSAEIGTLGSDAITGFTSLNGATSASTASNIGYNSGTGSLTVTGTPVTVSFATGLTSDEAAVLINLGWTASIGSQTVVIPAGTYDITGSLTSIGLQDPTSGSPGDETITIAGFTGGGVTGAVNGAGVIVSVSEGINGSTVSVSDNVIVGQANGNTAANAVSATGTSVQGLGATATSITAGDGDVTPRNSDLAATNVQDNNAALTSDVAGTFAIAETSDVSNATQTVSNNLQQSFATANSATSSVVITATNTDADTALESVQTSAATVATTSDVDVFANVDSVDSALVMEGNKNQSVANGNIVDNTITLDVTNADSPAAVNASGTSTTSNFTANNALVSRQSVTEDVIATATTDVYNEELLDAGGNEIITSSVSLGGNATVAQATGNSGGAGNALVLGDGNTANMERTGVLINLQTVAGEAVSATTDQDVSVSLTNTGTVPVQTSNISLDGNSTTALARSNVMTNTISVDGANINAGDTATDGAYNETAGSLVGAYVLGSTQDNAAGVIATTAQSRVEVEVTNTGGNVIDSSTLSVSGNASSATAMANSVVNSVSVGGTASNVNATAALGNTQNNTGAVLATGGSAVSVIATTTGGADPVGINATSVTLSGNSSASNAVGNQAQNQLTAGGTNIVSGVTSTDAAVDATTFGALTASAGNLLLSNQDNTASITSANTNNVVTINSSAVAGPVVIPLVVPLLGAAASGSTLSVAGNTTEARATANLVLNNSISLGGASTASADATSMIANFQFNDETGAVEAMASTVTSVALNGATTAGALSNGSASVQDNSTLALARGNVANNVLIAEGANVSAGSTAAAINTNTSPDAGVLNASFGVFNEQVQQATVSATSVDASYAINATSGTGDALNASSAMVGGNSINASAYGNIGTNSVTLASLNGASNTATAAVFNGQINSGAITSTVSGAFIGTYSMGGVSSASIGVMSNSISSTAVGNYATSTVTRATR